MELKNYILYGAGGEAERFIFCNGDIIDKIKLCIDDNRKQFYKIPVCKLKDVKVIMGYDEKIIVAAGDENMYSEMKQNLVSLGLVEFEDFIWSKAFRKKIVVVNANCHGSVVINYLQLSPTFCKTYMIYPVPEIHLNDEIPSCLLKNTDVYIHQDIRENNSISYKLSDAYICPRLKPDAINICIPNFVGMGKWMFPALGGLDKVMHTLTGPKYILYRDYVLDEAVHQYETLDEYRAFWINYKFDSTEHAKFFEECMNKLVVREKNWDIKISDFVKNNYKRIPCFVDANHPSKYVMKEVGRQVANILGLSDINDENYESLLGICIPMMRDIIDYYQLDFVVPPEVKKEYLDKIVEIDVDDYIRAYLWWYHEIRVSEGRNIT